MPRNKLRKQKGAQMFYKMTYDMDSIDGLLRRGESYLYAEADNLDEIEYLGIKKGFFNTVILKDGEIENWPDVRFYYSSTASGRESDYLLNASRWPLIHSNVKTAFEASGIQGVSYHKISLIDVASSHVNNDYYLLQLHSFIDAFDMERSSYKFSQRHNVYTFIPHQTYLNTANCAPHDLFRCRLSPAAIYASEKIVAIVRDHRFTGFSFLPQK